ncbi:MAG: PDGLE domain-containing protein [bacterium]
MKKMFLVTILIAITASFFASAYPDGLEWVAGQFGFINLGVERVSLMGDNNTLIGVCGVLIILALFWGSARVLKKIG